MTRASSRSGEGHRRIWDFITERTFICVVVTEEVGGSSEFHNLVADSSNALFQLVKMRQLSEDRTKILFEKLSKYIGSNTKLLIDRPDGLYCFREKNNRVYYASEQLLKQSSNVNPDNLISVGVCFGKFTKSGKFRLHITCLHYIAPYAQYKVWVKPGAEQQVLYGHNVLKSGLGRITESAPKYQGVIIYSMSDVPLGFGVTAKSTAECKHADPLTVVCFTQSDIGEYIRCEDDLL